MYDEHPNDDDFDADDSIINDDADGEEPTVPCPYCRREIHEDAQRCPYCEQYISEEDRPASTKPWWIVAGVAVCLYLVYRWIVG